MPVKPWKLFDTRECQLGEGPFYDERDGRVYWVDILSSRIHWRAFDDSEAGSEAGEIVVPGHVGAAVPRDGGGIVACLPTGLLPVDLVRVVGTTHANAAEEQPPVQDQRGYMARYPVSDETLRSNDAKADPRGRLWHGTMAYDEGEGRGALYRLDPGADAPIVMLPNVTVSNGMGWSPDGTTMYYIDSPTRRVDAFDFDMETGSLGARRTFATIEEGFPDGMCVDAEGGLWVAIWQGHRVIRFLPDGRTDRVLELPVPKVTSCAFAGPSLDTLIVTTVGPVYAFEIDDVHGTEVDRFAG